MQKKGLDKGKVQRKQIFSVLAGKTQEKRDKKTGKVKPQVDSEEAREFIEYFGAKMTGDTDMA
jgi:hypothetical protein